MLMLTAAYVPPIYHLKLNQLYEAIKFSVRTVFAEGVHWTNLIKIMPLGSGRASEDTFTILRYILICVNKVLPKEGEGYYIGEPKP